jgi:hypothetical protein
MFSSAMHEVAEEGVSEASIPSASKSRHRSQPHQIPLPQSFETAEAKTAATPEASRYENPKPRPPERPGLWALGPDRLVTSSRDLRLETPTFAADVDSQRVFPAIAERPPLLTNTTQPIGETAARASRGSSSEPDDVHIHIGRIEVTAVQATPPHPPKPRHAATSLTEYLKRRNGRAS